jgi:hypothetical protein
MGRLQRWCLLNIGFYGGTILLSLTGLWTAQDLVIMLTAEAVTSLAYELFFVPKAAPCVVMISKPGES